MKPITLLTAACLLVAGAHAARVGIWNYDTLDRFEDPELGTEIDCAYWVQRSLSSQGHHVEVFDADLPEYLDRYDVVFCLMGWYRC
jgi:hypothetical protein